MSEKVYKGSCYCGAVRWEGTGKPLLSGYCHCTLCQRLAGTSTVFSAYGNVTHKYLQLLLSFIQSTSLQMRSNGRTRNQYTVTLIFMLLKRNHGRNVGDVRVVELALHHSMRRGIDGVYGELILRGTRKGGSRNGRISNPASICFMGQGHLKLMIIYRNGLGILESQRGWIEY